MSEKEKINQQDAIKHIVFPVRFDEYGGGYIWDAEQNMVAQVRGWGRLQKLPQGDLIQDAIGQFITDAMNEKVRPVCESREKESGWIPVSEKLPDSLKPVLAAFVVGEYRGVDIFKFYKGEWTDSRGELFTVGQIVAWREISPFESDGEGKL